jgi:hypothetical protein
MLRLCRRQYEFLAPSQCLQDPGGSTHDHCLFVEGVFCFEFGALEKVMHDQHHTYTDDIDKDPELTTSYYTTPTKSWRTLAFATYLSVLASTNFTSYLTSFISSCAAPVGGSSTPRRAVQKVAR